MFYTVILIDHFTLWQKGQRKLWNPLFCITISWDASVMPICQHTKTRCCSTHQVAKNRIGKYNNGFFYFFMFDTWFVTSFRSCCIAYFKDKSAKKLSRRKIETDFFPPFLADLRILLTLFYETWFYHKNYITKLLLMRDTNETR